MLTYYLLVGLVLAVWYGLYRLWHRRIDEDASEGAAFEFDRLERQDPDLLEGLDLASFTAIYARVVTPRAPIYIFGAMAIFLLAAPFVLALTAITIGIMERTGVIPQPAEAAQRLRVSSEGIKLIQTADVEALQLILQGWGGFFFFFSLLIFWTLAFFFTMRRFHKRRPGSLRDEILRAR